MEQKAPPLENANMNLRFGIIGLAMVAAAPMGAAELRVPASTAYLAPNPDGARVSAKSGITRWQDPKIKILWFGEFKMPGKLTAAVVVNLPKDAVSTLRLNVGDQAREATAVGTGHGRPVNFGEFAIPAAGYQGFTLKAL